MNAKQPGPRESSRYLALPASDAADLIRRGEVSSSELTGACLARTAALNPGYQAYVTVLADRALEDARRADEAVERGDRLGPLHGVPVSVKDAFCMMDTRTTIGMTSLRDSWTPDQRDAACVERLRRAGAVILGKTNVGSGIARADAEGARLPPARNPWARDRTPGGSSSGSAVAVALGMGYASVGSDSGGSIRIPAAFCGIVGLKPTYGRVSLDGDVYGLGQRLEHVGPLTRTVRDAGLLFQVLADREPESGASAGAARPEDVLTAIERGADGPAVRVGWARSAGVEAERDVVARVEDAVNVLSAHGLRVDEIRLPTCPTAVWSQLVLVGEWEGYDAGTNENRPYYAYIRDTLARMRRKIAAELEAEAAGINAAYERLFKLYDILALPTVPITAKPLNMWRLAFSGKEWDTVDLHSINTCPLNVTGHPAVSVPCGLSGEGLPVGLQLAARKHREDLLLGVAATYERAVGGFPSPPDAGTGGL